MSIILDASAWIELFADTRIGKRVQEYLDSYECMTPVVVLAEVCSKLKKYGFDVDEPYNAMLTTEIISLTPEIARTAGLLHAEKHQENKFALSDAIVLALARQHKAKILTKDSDFRNVPEAILLK